MDFYVFDQDYTLLGILTSPISVTYTEKYNDLGDFQVNLPVDEINRELIKSDNIILFDKEKGTAGIIGIISADGETDGTPQIIAKGKLIEEYIYRRICWGLFSTTETPENVIYNMLTTQVISPTDPDRAIADIVLKESVLKEAQKISYQNTGQCPFFAVRSGFFGIFTLQILLQIPSFLQKERGFLQNIVLTHSVSIPYFVVKG